jgi:hypothetical protein
LLVGLERGFFVLVEAARAAPMKRMAVMEKCILLTDGGDLKAVFSSEWIM